MRYWKLVTSYVILLLALSLIPTGDQFALDRLNLLSFRLDYIAHTIAFIPWMIFAWLHISCRKLTGPVRFRQAAIWFIAGIAIAIFAEAVHYWLPYRSFNQVDLLYNLYGILIGSLIFIWKLNPNQIN